MTSITYMLDCEQWPGLAKHTEESGEVGRIIGKIMSNNGQVLYQWEDINLAEELEQELGDQLATIRWIIEKCPHICMEKALERADHKFSLYESWTKTT